MGWIEELKSAVTFNQVAATFGMREVSRKRWSPCAACGNSRTDSDPRACVGVGADGGWVCRSCNERGDVLALICFALTKTSSPSEAGWSEVRKYAADHGWIKSAGQSPASSRVRQFSRTVERPGRELKPSAPTVSPEETPEERQVNTKGWFRWSDDLPERCARIYADPSLAAGWSPAHQQIVKNVVRYLVEYRQILDEVLLDAKIGVYVDADGNMILDGGRPYITIPLPDKAGRFVNVHFRRVPIPGTCQDCDALGPWKECDACRKHKRYRLCPGRPTPLYGADRLTPGNGAVARVVEGEFDVLALRSYGLGDNTTSGTTGAGNFSDDWLDSLEPFDSIFLCYDDDPAGKKGAADLAAKLGLYKCSKVVFPKKDAGDCRIEHVPVETIHRAFKVAESYLDIRLLKANEYAVDLRTLLERPETLKGVSTGSEVMDTAIGGWANGMVVVTGESGNGKAQPVDEPVLTPTGWRPIGDLRMGDQAVSVDGKPTTVIGVFPQGVRKICRVTFNDGAVVRCDLDHLWTVTMFEATARRPYGTHGNGGRWTVRKTSEISDTMNTNAWCVPVMDGRGSDPHQIVSIEDAGEAECVCIAVAHPSRLYVTTGYTVTHNTTWTTWALWKLAHAGHAVAITSFEQQPIMTVLQLLSMEMGGDPTERTREEREAALDRLSELPLYIVDHYGQLPWTKLEEALKYAVRRCGVRYVLVDHLGFLIDPDADDERRAIQAVIRSMVLLRKDMDVTLFLIVHPRNDPDASKKFGRVTMQHLKGASAIRQDADLVLVVTRELPNTEKGRMLPKTKRRPWPQTRIYIDKKRGRFGAVSGAGEVVMAFDPKSQTFADTWPETPLGRTGALIDSAPSETQDESEQPETTKGRGGGAKRGGSGRKRNAGGSSTADF